MSRYIDAEKVAEELSKVPWYKREDEKQAVRMVKEFPAADVQEVKHGRWEKTGVNRYAIDMRFTVYEWKCSCCGKRKWDAELPKENYCSNCGASMDGDTE